MHPFVDRDLARRIERNHAFAAVTFARALAGERPGSAAIEPMGGGFAVDTGADSPITKAAAVGLDGPVDPAELERIEAFFHGRGSPCRFELAPLVDPGVADWAGRRGYRPVEFENVLVRPLDPDEPAPGPPTGMEVRPARPDEDARFAGVVCPGFFGDAPVPPAVADFFRLGAHADGQSQFLVFLDGEPIAGAVLFVQGGLALLAGASTLAAHRNRGAHAALHHARLAAAARAGCDLAVVNTLPATTSQRNAERRGFRVAYTRVAFVRDPA